MDKLIPALVGMFMLVLIVGSLVGMQLVALKAARFDERFDLSEPALAATTAFRERRYAAEQALHGIAAGVFLGATVPTAFAVIAASGLTSNQKVVIGVGVVVVFVMMLFLEAMLGMFGFTSLNLPSWTWFSLFAISAIAAGLICVPLASMAAELL